MKNGLFSMAKKHKPRMAAFNIAAAPLCLFGCPNGVRMYPFHVPAGAWYGRDKHGYWVYFNPFAEFRGMAEYEVWRFSAQSHRWECVTATPWLCKLIAYQLDKRPVKNSAIVAALRMDKDDKAALSKIPLSGKKYVNPRSLNRGYRESVKARENESCAVRMHPAEQMYSALDYMK